MNVGVLASHEGTTLQSLLDAFAAGRIQGRIAVVVSNNGDSGALRRARQAGVQAVHLSSKTHEDPAALDAAIRGALRNSWSKRLGRLRQAKSVSSQVLADAARRCHSAWSGAAFAGKDS